MTDKLPVIPEGTLHRQPPNPQASKAGFYLNTS